MGLISRLFASVKMPDGCWEWTGGTNRPGYGRIKVKGKMFSPHRLMFEIFHGPLQKGEWVLHHCDNPPCVNPAHLFKGSPSDNMKDCAAKGRLNVQNDASHIQGENNSRSKLTDEIVREIRHSAGIVPIKRMASRFGVHKKVIQDVIKRRCWAHVSDEGSA